MSEREIRNIVRSVCADLDERARRAANARIQKVVLPAALGVTLAVSGCALESHPEYAAPMPDSAQVQPDASIEGGPGAEAGNPDPGPVLEYAAPAPDAGIVALYAAPRPDAGAIPPYMAIMPDASADGGTSKDAQAASDDAGQASDATQVDAGAVLEYMAVFPDAGVQVLYMAVIVDSGDKTPDPTPVPLYDAPVPEK